MSKFARLSKPFRKFGSDSKRGTEPLPPAPYPTPPSPVPEPAPRRSLAALLRKSSPVARLAERVGLSPTDHTSPVTELPEDEHRTWRDWRPRFALRGRGSTPLAEPILIPEPEPEPEPKLTFATKHAVAASVGAVAVVALGVVGFVQLGGPDEPAPQPAAAYTEADPAPREPDREPAPLPAEDVEPAPDSAIAPEAADLVEPGPALPDEALPDTPAGEPAPAAVPPPAPIAEPAPAANPVPAPAPDPAQAPAPAPAPAGFMYKNCAEARAAGATPILAGTPGFGPHLDKDGDGVGCQSG